MEDILSSIKRIIAEEGESAVSRGRRPGRGAPASASVGAAASQDAAPNAAPNAALRERAASVAADDGEVLELSDPVGEDDLREPAPAPRSAKATPVRREPEASPADAILSDSAAEASRGALDNLSRLLVKPQAQGGETLEGLVREMLRPMLREWLDSKLPGMVEAMVAREIARITQGR